MKILIHVDVDFEHVEDESITTHTIPSRRYNVYNEDDLKRAIDNMASDIELLIETKQFDKSGLLHVPPHYYWSSLENQVSWGRLRKYKKDGRGAPYPFLVSISQYHYILYWVLFLGAGLVCWGLCKA